jgi:hypothetical protein
LPFLAFFVPCLLFLFAWNYRKNTEEKQKQMAEMACPEIYSSTHKIQHQHSYKKQQT